VFPVDSQRFFVMRSCILEGTILSKDVSQVPDSVSQPEPIWLALINVDSFPVVLNGDAIVLEVSVNLSQTHERVG